MLPLDVMSWMTGPLDVTPEILMGDVMIYTHQVCPQTEK
jgi:hypothetical protein